MEKEKEKRKGRRNNTNSLGNIRSVLCFSLLSACRICPPTSLERADEQTVCLKESSKDRKKPPADGCNRKTSLIQLSEVEGE